MESSHPIKNFLPSRKIQIIIGIIILVIVAVFAVPRVFKLFQSPTATPQKNLSVINPTGDPTTRDSDGDGIFDWREIAVGLDPHKTETTKGTPDVQAFETFKSNIGYDLFAQAETNTTDTDKLSLTLSSDITRTLQTGIATDVALSDVTAKEMLNYIDSQKKQIVQFSAVDITTTENTLETNQIYAQRMREILRDDAATKNFSSDVKAYLNGGGSKIAIESNVASIEKTLTALKSVPVPTPAIATHLEIVNALQGIYQTVKIIDPSSQDDVSKLSTSALLQDYTILFLTSTGKLSIYFSVALDKNGYVQ